MVENGFTDALSKQRDRWYRIIWVSYERLVGSILLAKLVAYAKAYTSQSKSFSCCCTGREIILIVVLLQFRIRHICFITTSLTCDFCNKSHKYTIDLSESESAYIVTQWLLSWIICINNPFFWTENWCNFPKTVSSN